MNSSTSYNLDLIRANYDKVFLYRELCKKMIVELDREKNNSATYLGYLGGLQAIWANHVINPILMRILNLLRKIEIKFV